MHSICKLWTLCLGGVEGKDQVRGTGQRSFNIGNPREELQKILDHQVFTCLKNYIHQGSSVLFPRAENHQGAVGIEQETVLWF